MTRMLKTKLKMQYLVTVLNKNTGVTQTQMVLAKNTAAASTIAVRKVKAKAATMAERQYGDFVVVACDAST